MIRLAQERSTALTGVLPSGTLAFLCDPGVPEFVVLCGIQHVFTLDLEPLLDGDVFRIGSVDPGWYTMAVQRKTGHFGYVVAEAGQPPWSFCNSSVACFLLCVAASERVWQMECARQIEWEARGEFLERAIREIDPAVFVDEENFWSVLVEEVRNGVV